MGIDFHITCIYQDDLKIPHNFIGERISNFLYGPGFILFFFSLHLTYGDEIKVKLKPPCPPVNLYLCPN